MSITLKGGYTTEDRRLDRVPSETTEHREKYPFRRETLEEVGVTEPTPMAIGINWYSAFDTPVKGRDGRWRVAQDGNVGRLRGGHCVCLPHRGFKDVYGWWLYYNQGREGRCVQFGCSRALSLLRRQRYRISEDEIGRWHYWEAQRTDEWAGGSYPGASPHYEGTSVRAGLEVMRAYGVVKNRGTAPDPNESISAYRWAPENGMNDVLAALGREDEEEIPWINSWGRNYPRVVWVPVTVHARTLNEWGEYGIITPR